MDKRKLPSGIGKRAKAIKPLAWTPRPEVLLDPPIPLPLSGTAPRVVLGQAWWDKTRREASRLTNQCCIVCGLKAPRIEGHERYSIDWLLGQALYLETVPLCSDCHSFIHPGFLRAEQRAGKITAQEIERIMERGRGILRTAGLSRPDDSVHKNWASVEWAEWRLIVEGKEYPPMYDSWEEFQKELG